uniref:MIP30789p n=1 Tax=Drosophila melanogaster TaxID=7227 RepID=F3YDM1_DROME|nr:MIP30789p [Drosophila melanogaster]
MATASIVCPTFDVWVARMLRCWDAGPLGCLKWMTTTSQFRRIWPPQSTCHNGSQSENPRIVGPAPRGDGAGDGDAVAGVEVEVGVKLGAGIWVSIPFSTVTAIFWHDS